MNAGNEPKQDTTAPAAGQLCWQQDGAVRSAYWHSEARLPPPRRVQLADDTLSADAAYRLACEGTALLWCGDFQNARQLLQAMARRIDKKSERSAGSRRGTAGTDGPAPGELFNRKRMAQAQRARTLGMLLIPFTADHSIPLRRAPDARLACAEAWGSAVASLTPNGVEEVVYVATLRELLGAIGAHEWRKKGVPLAALGGDRIHPHYGVFSPVRGEYVDLVARAPLPPALHTGSCAFDIGTGTGVLAAVLARRGVGRVVATDQDLRALACARENGERLGLSAHIDWLQADLYPPGRAALVVCNPPWLPARPSSPLEYAVYDPDGRMLHGFLGGLASHLEEGGEGWLILSDLAEHLGLRSRQSLLSAFADAGLTVRGRLDTRPTHARAADASDPLHAARAAEVTSLWRLAAA